MLAVSALFAGVPAHAEPPPFPEFTFRTVVPPPPGYTGPRITIQIEPQPEPEPQIAAPELPEPEPGAPSAWFWAAVPAYLDVPDRVEIALAHMAGASETGALPIMQPDGLQRLAATHGRDILAASVGTDVSPALVLAVIAVESSGRPDAVSGAGAEGLMQLIPATADRFGVQDPFDPQQNIGGGVAYLHWLLGEFDRDEILALAGYNAGEGAVQRSGGVPDYAETRDYIPKVLATWTLVRELCVTPPEALSDGCVFTALSAS
ncbi:MAG: transglycosylase SLT domain-containing protein [Pseudomonadota bacterium]